MQSTILDRPVGQLVAEQPSRSRVFESWGIDYCCGGRKTLADACAAKQLEPAKVVQDLEAADSTATPPETDWTQESLAKLSKHIVDAHHAYLRHELPRLSMLTAKVADVHAGKDPRLADLQELFEGFRADMETHMEEEEQLVFPAIAAVASGVPGDALANPIDKMFAEHDDAGIHLEKMRTLTDGFVPKEDACNTHRALLHALGELELDMHQHVHLENNVLFKRALEMGRALG